MRGHPFMVRRYTATDGCVVYYREVNGRAWIKSDVEVLLDEEELDRELSGVTR